ncbi:hypothetical protein ID866_8464 [Astraeus odoratus]|nr:hypothetical protein ID866_8464 [Astraeus odoratus]
MANFPYVVFFTGIDDPRDGCNIIGEDDKPVYFEFEVGASTHTTIYSNRQPVAALDWGDGSGLRRASISGRDVTADQLTIPGSVPNARAFVSGVDGRIYEWRRSYQEPNSYELWAGPTQIAVFDKFIYQTPTGPSHATLSYNFTDSLFLLEALVTLNLNRWLDMNKMA